MSSSRDLSPALGVKEKKPWPTRAAGGSIKAFAIGSRALKTRRANPKRGILGGKRLIAMWKVDGDDTYLIAIRAGQHVNELRLSEEALDAIADLLDEHKGRQGFKLVYRVVTKDVPAPDTTERPPHLREDSQ